MKYKVVGHIVDEAERNYSLTELLSTMELTGKGYSICSTRKMTSQKGGLLGQVLIYLEDDGRARKMSLDVEAQPSH